MLPRKPKKKSDELETKTGGGSISVPTTETAQTIIPPQEQAMTEETIRIVTLKSWSTGVFNENQMPILNLETFDGQKLNVFLTPEAAVELGQSLVRTGEQTSLRVPTVTN